IIERRIGRNSLGFGSELNQNKEEHDEILNNVVQHDLVKYGLIPELIGRIPVISVLQNLDKEDLVKIMTEPKNSIVKQYTKLFEMDDVTLEFQKEALEAMADITLERKTGARGLRSVFEKVLGELMYTVPSDCTIEKIVVTEDSVKNSTKPLIRTNPKRKPVDLSSDKLKNA
ncbi:MAG: ATP-dependent Clp protease ATP-binding subunit ClpX, partial [Eubacterium sp.]|nr:ATP-dependent Clp protease ATP-binding subunit ClpX [Eubacterium sp.]